MKTNYFFMLLGCLFFMKGYPEKACYDFIISPDYVKESLFIQLKIEQTGNDKNYFLFSDNAYITGLKINDSVIHKYIQQNDTLFLPSANIDKMEINYTLPLKDYTTNTGAIILKKEGKWYPYQEQALISSIIRTVNHSDYYVVSLGKEDNYSNNVIFTNIISNEIHLFFLPVRHFSKDTRIANKKAFNVYKTINDSTNRDTFLMNLCMPICIFVLSFQTN
jgi:hypothetical protein